ncbi:hypothetical protein ACSTCY_21515, partial [Klebsiella pneumoniae]
MHKIKYYFLNELNFHGRNAGFKARVDALTVFSSNPGVQVVNIPLWGGLWSMSLLKISEPRIPRVIAISVLGFK